MPAILGILRDYLWVIWFKLESLWTTPPASWQSGSKGDVVIIPGFFGSWNFLRQVGDHFNHLGFRIWTIPQLGLNLSSLENSVQIVKNFLVTHHITQPIFISHSKGGLIAKSLLYDDSIQTKYCISFSTPYQGTYLGYFYFGHANEFIPNSTALNKLASHSTRNSRIWALYSRLDNFVLPNKYLALPGAHNIQLDIVGHTRILTSAKTLATISQIILPPVST
jgi:hypothetical protein